MAETALLVHASPAAAEVGEEPQPPAAPAAALAKTAVTEAVVRERLLALLQQSDLQTTTERTLRKQLEAELGDLKAHKEFIRKEVTTYLDAQQAAEEAAADGVEDEEEEDVKPAAKRRKAAFGVCELSEPLAALLQRDVLPRNRVVKKLWTYIKENNLQNPANKTKIVLDSQLEKIFQNPLSMFSMNKQLSKHCHPAPAGAVYEPSSDEEGEAAEAKPKRKRKSSGGSGRQPGGFAKAVPVSQELADWMQLDEPLTTRGQVTKHFWSYVKEKGLQDPQSPKTILSDDVLLQLTGGQASFSGPASGFGFAKYLSHHFLKEAPS